MQLRINSPTVAARRISWRCDASPGAESFGAGSTAIDVTSRYSVRSTMVAPEAFFCTEAMPICTLALDS
jgi:hypothetical protein